MAYIATAHNAADHRSLMSRVLTALGNFFSDYAEARSRSAEIEALTRLTDAELAKRGLTREGIVHHVFSSSFYL
ncbi:DUF1127 domain-containing protein [Sinisalibacter aestuarii]|uniref:DUF1127 domain-containing protein n=1 Tax=Sinisalibacter aestuarii TaxID=2949426 RepID=A0ABQ5LW07_9RHOB|nr:DUF1127 domain-containing protein [Sinisalibacter aestuarii]GKY89146.1 hypothetical protein STA1M1_30150 [Sinisalibacter aestuarii]